MHVCLLSFPLIVFLVPSGNDKSVAEVIGRIRDLGLECVKIRGALNEQKHAFHFRYLLSLQGVCEVRI